MARLAHGRDSIGVIQDAWFDRSPDLMHSHPAKDLPTVAVNALWCLLIALALLAFPLIARQVRLQSGLPTQRISTSSAAPVSPAENTALPVNDAELVVAHH